jgi:glycosyltransferase involved in cell wall biosynthesis
MVMPPDARAPVRVLLIVTRLNIGGPARHVVTLAERLGEAGFAVLLAHGSIGPEEGSLEDLPGCAGVRVARLDTLRRALHPWDDLRTIAAIYRLARRERPSIVHTHTSKAGALGRIAAFLYNCTSGRREPARVIHTFHGHVLHGYFGAVGTSVVRAVERALARMTDRIIALSPSQARDLVDVYRIAPASAVDIVPLALDLREFTAAPTGDRGVRGSLGFGEGDFVFGYVGRLTGIKDLPMLMRAFAQFAREQPAAALVLVGDGEQRTALESLVRELGIERRVRFAGWQRGLGAVYRSLDAVVLSSINEGTPTALIEAMAAGRPVIATSVGGVPDLVQDGATGLLVPARDPEALAAAMARLYRLDEAERAAMAVRARAFVASRFEADRLVTDTRRVYLAALSTRRDRRGQGA